MIVSFSPCWCWFFHLHTGRDQIGPFPSQSLVTASTLPSNHKQAWPCYIVPYCIIVSYVIASSVIVASVVALSVILSSVIVASAIVSCTSRRPWIVFPCFLVRVIITKYSSAVSFYLFLFKQYFSQNRSPTSLHQKRLLRVFLWRHCSWLIVLASDMWRYLM